MITSNKGIELIKKYESLHDGHLKKIGLQPKMCPAGYWTEGYGSLVLDSRGKKIKGKENEALAIQCSKITNEAQAIQLLAIALKERETFINGLGLKLTQGQFDALICLVYNIGRDNLNTSTLLKKVRVNPKDASITAEFNKWIYANGVRQLGLVYRRKAEALLYFS